MLGQRLAHGVSPNICTKQLFQKLWWENATLLFRKHHPGPLALDLHYYNFLFLSLFLLSYTSLAFYFQKLIIAAKNHIS